MVLHRDLVLRAHGGHSGKLPIAMRRVAGTHSPARSRNVASTPRRKTATARYVLLFLLPTTIADDNLQDFLAMCTSPLQCPIHPSSAPPAPLQFTHLVLRLLCDGLPCHRAVHLRAEVLHGVLPGTYILHSLTSGVASWCRCAPSGARFRTTGGSASL